MCSCALLQLTFVILAILVLTSASSVELTGQRRDRCLKSLINHVDDINEFMKRHKKTGEFTLRQYYVVTRRIGAAKIWAQYGQDRINALHARIKYTEMNAVVIAALTNMTVPQQELVQVLSTTWFSLLLNLAHNPMAMPPLNDFEHAKLTRKTLETMRWMEKYAGNATDLEVRQKQEALTFLVKDFNLYVPLDAFFGGRRKKETDSKK